MIDINLQSWTEELTSLWYYLNYEVPKWKIIIVEIGTFLYIPIFAIKQLIIRIKYRHL